MDWIVEQIQAGIAKLPEVLPLSPLQPFIREIKDLPWLGVLNWVIPFETIGRIMEAYLVSVAIFYGASIFLRWIKVLGD